MEEIQFDPKVPIPALEKIANDILGRKQEMKISISSKLNEYNPNEYKIKMNQTQRYYIKKPVSLTEVKGTPASIIFLFMTHGKIPSLFKFSGNYPQDVVDFERCEAILICYPDWRNWMKDLKAISKRWALFGEQWEQLAELYHDDIYECGQMIRAICNYQVNVHDYDCPIANKDANFCRWCLS